MMNTLTRFAAAATLAVVTSGCAMSLRSPDIADLQRHPGRYQDRTVSVNGIVTSSWGLPLVPFRFYKVDDGTGEVTVLSEGSRMPAKPAKQTREIERIQTGVRLEKRLLKVLKGLAEYLDLSLGDLLEGVALHALENKPPFKPATLEKIANLKRIYGLDLTAADSHQLRER